MPVRRIMLAAMFLGIGLAVVLATPLTALADMTVWFAPSSIKILRNAEPNPQAGDWDLASARNEVEACQVVLSADHPLTGVKVNVTDFRLEDGSAAIKPQLFKVEYVPNIVGETAYPDPLPPLTPFDVAANQAQPVWISVKTPIDAKPGVYQATVQVESGAEKRELPLKLHVWNFALPVTPSSVTAFGMMSNFIAEQHGVPNGSLECISLYDKYYEMLLDHRISAYQIPADIMSEEAAKYLKHPRMTSYQLPYSDDDAKLKGMVDHLIKNGWYDKGYFYPIDEPVEKAAYADLTKIGKRLMNLPSYRWVVPFFRSPAWDNELTPFDLMANHVNIWCPNTAYFDSNPKTRPSMATRHRMGEAAWWYVCCGPGSPYNNFFVEMSGMSHRMLFWQQKHENVEGLLYWCSTWWNPASIKDPWTDMATVKDINPSIHGDGSLFYPGKKVGVDGPVSSIRLELIRDGLEDFDYLTLADAKLGKEATAKYVERMVRNLKDYEQDPAALEQCRREIGDLLEKQP
jgi:hypothetical protein